MAILIGIVVLIVVVVLVIPSSQQKQPQPQEDNVISEDTIDALADTDTLPPTKMVNIIVNDGEEGQYDDCEYDDIIVDDDDPFDHDGGSGSIPSTTLPQSISMLHMIFACIMLISIGSIVGFGSFHFMFTNKLGTLTTQVNQHRNDSYNDLLSKLLDEGDDSQCQDDLQEYKNLLEFEKGRWEAHGIFESRYKS